MPMMGQQRGRPSLNVVAQNRPLPALRPQGQVVGTPRALPGLIPYGPQPQGLEQSTRFTGGNVPGGAMSLTHPEQQIPTFQEPQYQAPQQVQQPQQVSRLAALLAAPTAAFGMAAAPSGATAAPTATPVGGTTPAPPAWTGTGFVPLPPGPGPGPSSLGPPGPTQPTNPAAGLSALIAALSQRGQKIGHGGNVHPFV